MENKIQVFENPEFGEVHALTIDVEPVKPRCNCVVDYSPYINTTPGKLPWDNKRRYKK